MKAFGEMEGDAVEEEAKRSNAAGARRRSELE